MESTVTEQDKLDVAKFIFDNDYHTQTRLQKIEDMFERQLRSIEECTESNCKHLTCKFARNWRANTHNIRVNR